MDNVPANTSSRHIEDQFPIVDSDISQIGTIQASLYTIVDNTIHVDNFFFQKDDAPSENDVEDNVKQASTSRKQSPT